MTEYDYHVWFRNSLLQPDEQDYEWIACIRIRANDAESAKKWGDVLARDYSVRTINEFLRSGVESASTHPLPLVLFGQHASDDDIGW